MPDQYTITIPSQINKLCVQARNQGTSGFRRDRPAIPTYRVSKAAVTLNAERKSTA